MTTTTYNSNNDNDNEVSNLSTRQENVLVFLPIIPSLLSIIGSCTIIHIVVNSKKKSTYRRLMLGLSICDLVTSIYYPLVSFLSPFSSSSKTTTTTTRRLFGFGNGATCSVIGFFLQLSFARLIYNAMLSFYFLISIRNQRQSARLVKLCEPIMHIISIGYPVITAMIGSINGYYHELELGPGCWVADYPVGCSGDHSDSNNNNNDNNIFGNDNNENYMNTTSLSNATNINSNLNDTSPCKSLWIAWIFGGSIFIFLLLAFIINNTLIYYHVKKLDQRQQQKQQRLQLEKTETKNNNDHVKKKLSMSTSSVKNDNNNNNDNDNNNNNATIPQPRLEYSLSCATLVAANTATTNNNNNNNNATRGPDSANGSVSASAAAASAFACASAVSVTSSSSSPSISFSATRTAHMIQSQAYLYVTACLLTYTWTFIIRILEFQSFSPSKESSIYWILILQNLCLPLQGFFNVLVFLRPSFMKIQHDYSYETLTQKLQLAIMYEIKKRNINNNHHHHRRRQQQNDVVNNINIVEETVNDDFVICRQERSSSILSSSAFSSSVARTMSDVWNKSSTTLSKCFSTALSPMSMELTTNAIGGDRRSISKARSKSRSFHIAPDSAHKNATYNHCSSNISTTTTSLSVMDVTSRNNNNDDSQLQQQQQQQLLQGNNIQELSMVSPTNSMTGHLEDDDYDYDDNDDNVLQKQNNSCSLPWIPHNIPSLEEYKRYQYPLTNPPLPKQQEHNQQIDDGIIVNNNNSWSTISTLNTSTPNIMDDCMIQNNNDCSWYNSHDNLMKAVVVEEEIINNEEIENENDLLFSIMSENEIRQLQLQQEEVDLDHELQRVRKLSDELSDWSREDANSITKE